MSATEEEMLRRMDRALSKLKPIQREVFLLSAAEGLACSEVGRRLGLSVEQAKRHLVDALYNLDRRMERAERPWWRFW